MRVIKIEGSELRSVLRQLRVPDAEANKVWSLRVSVHGDRVMVKVNGGMWSPAYGGLDGA